jgi:hypothetical protein
MDIVRGRGPFSFWAPLNEDFMQTAQALANYTNMLYLVPQFPVYMFAQQTYGGTVANGGAANCTCTTTSCSDYDIQQTENSLAAAADQISVYTDTGVNYYNQLVTTPDRSAVRPAQPDRLGRLHHGESFMGRFQRQRRSRSGLQPVSLHSAGGRPTLHGGLSRHHDSAGLQRLLTDERRAV